MIVTGWPQWLQKFIRVYQVDAKRDERSQNKARAPEKPECTWQYMRILRGRATHLWQAQ